MDPTTIIVVGVIVAIVIAIIVAGMRVASEKQAHQSADDKIKSYGIQHSIIKRTDTSIDHDSFSKPPGVLVLTWDKLYFFGENETREIPVTSIRSTSSEYKSGGSQLLVLADSGTFRFHWPDIKHSVRGIGVASDQIGAGMALTNSHDPIVQEWVKIIDDLRFRRLTKPS